MNISDLSLNQPKYHLVYQLSFVSYLYSISILHVLVVISRRLTPFVLTDVLQTGQIPLDFSQRFTHSVWNPCRQGKDVLSSPDSKSSKQIEHCRLSSGSSLFGSPTFDTGSDEIAPDDAPRFSLPSPNLSNSWKKVKERR